MRINLIPHVYFYLKSEISLGTILRHCFRLCILYTIRNTNYNTMSKIAEIQTIPFRLPMAGALKWGQASQMNKLEHVLVRVITDTGKVGQAEALPRPTIYGETPESIQTIIHHHLAPMLIGQSLVNIETLSNQMHLIANNHSAKGALDICLHEAHLLTEGKTLFEAFASKQTKRIKVSYILGISEPDIMFNEAQTVYQQGVRVFKVKVGRNFEQDISVLRRLQKAFVGSDVTLYADANECFTPNDAAERLKQLADLGLLYVEEPLPIEQILHRQALYKAHILPIIGDDSSFTTRELIRELAFNTFDILNIKTARTGYTQSQQMLALAYQHGKGVMVGSQASSTLGTIRAAIFAAQQGINHPSELSFFLKIKEDIVNKPISIQNGYLNLDDLRDITVDESKLAKLRF